MPRVFHDHVVINDLFINVDSDEPIRIPYQIQEIIYEMTLKYLVDRPLNVLDFCCDYFDQLKKNRSVEIVYVDPTPEEILGGEYNTRRETFCGSLMEEEAPDVRVYYEKSDSTRRDLENYLRDIVLFKYLEKEDVNTIIDALRKETVESGQIVIEEGNEGNNMFLIESGIYSAYRKEGCQQVKVKSYNNCGFFGELALLYDAPRAATVLAHTNGVLWVLDRATFRRIIVNKAIEKRKTYEKLIGNVPMFSSLTDKERQRLLDTLKARAFKKGEVIMSEGETADGMYFIEKGRVVITKRDPKTDKNVAVNVLKEGSFFGEVALIQNKPRMASAIASTDVSLAFVNVEAFERVLGPCIEIMKRQFDAYENRLKELFGSQHDLINLR